MEGNRSRLAQRRTWANDITDWAGIDYSNCIRLASDRRQRRLLVADLYERVGRDDESEMMSSHLTALPTRIQAGYKVDELWS